MKGLAVLIVALAFASCSTAREGAVDVIGLRSVLITDQARRDPVDATHPRQWMIDLYYRAHTHDAVVEPYARDSALLARMVANGYYEVSAADLNSWAQAPSPAIENATPAAGDNPLILLSPGSGLVGFNYAQLASELVRHGYVVAVVNEPYVGLQHLPDGRFLDANDDAVQASEDPAALTPRILEWSQDLSVTLDRLGDGAANGLHIDLSHVLAIGHSTGGAIALDACAVEARIDACMNFEGALFGSRAETGGVAKPVVSVGSRARGRPRGPGMGEQMLAALGQGGNASAWYVFVTGGSHMSFSDAPRMMPDTLTRFGGEIMPPERSDAVYAGMVDAFARAYATGGGGDEAFAAFLDSLPEAEFRSSGGRRSPERG